MAESARDDIIDLNTSDLDGPSELDLRSWTAHIIVHAMLSTPAGPRIDRDRLQALVKNHFGELLIAQRFDFGPLLAALIRIEGVTEADLYVGVISVIGQLTSIGIRMEEPAFRLTPLQKSALIDEAYTDTQYTKDEYEASRLRRAVTQLHAKRLGDLLLENQIVSEEQLSEGLKAQKEMGGRIGSNLVRMGYIDEEQLASFLGLQLGLPCLTKLSRVSTEAIRKVPRSLAEKYRVVPISVSDRDIGLAMADPSNLEAIDAVSFTTGLRVRPAVAPEVLIEYALARFYSIRTRLRLRRLDMHRAKAGSADLAPGQWAMSLDLMTADIGEQDEPLACGLGADDMGELAIALTESKTRDQVLTQLGDFLGKKFVNSVVFALDGTQVQGISAYGLPENGACITDVQIDVHQNPVLSDVFLRRGLFIGPEPPGHLWLGQLLGQPAGSDITVMPLLEHDRVAGIGVAGSRRSPCKDPIVEDQTLAQLGSTALSMIALRRCLISIAMKRNSD